MIHESYWLSLGGMPSSPPWGLMLFFQRQRLHGALGNLGKLHFSIPMRDISRSYMND